MNKLIIFAVALVLILSLSSISLAKTVQHKNLILNRIVIIEDAPLIRTSVVVDNDLGFDYKNGKVVISIPELGLRASKKIEIGSGRESKRVNLVIPDTVSGEYYVRIVVTNNDVTRIRHRLITI